MGAVNRLAATSRFFLFGMDNRRKFIYQAGRIIDAFTGETVRQWVWAEAHFYGDEPPMSLKGKGYPRSWEARVSQADYEERLGGKFTAKRIAVPHARHADGMFLSLGR